MLKTCDVISMASKESVCRGGSRQRAAQELAEIKHNFKTGHKRPPGPSADKELRELASANQNTGSRQSRTLPHPANNHLLNIHTSAGFEAPISGRF
jgi:hypothetical protein